jgi:hypothetical protein
MKREFKGRIGEITGALLGMGISEYEANRYERASATDQSFAKSIRHWE